VKAARIVYESVPKIINKWHNIFSSLANLNHNSFWVLFDKFASVYFISKYINILALEMASSRNRHCANYIGTRPDMTRHRQHRVSCLAGGVNWALVVISPPPLAPRGKTRVSRLVAYLVGHWHCPHSMLNRVYVTVRCPSVRPSVCLSACPVQLRRSSVDRALARRSAANAGSTVFTVKERGWPNTC